MAIGIYRCLYDFTAQLENDLSIYSGDVIKVTQQINSDWLSGIANNKVGQFPCSYVEKVLQGVPEKVGIVSSNFIAEQEGDLPIKKDDVVGILEYIDANWVRGYSRYGKGIFPAKFIKEVDFNILEGNENASDDKKYESKVSIPSGEALNDFHAQDVDELSISKGDEIELVREIDNFWTEGIMKGKKGKFPREFIKIIHDLPPSLKYCEPSKKDECETTIPHAKATHMFIGENSNEISFDKGDMVTLVSHFNKDWMKGKIGNSIGLFPVNHVKILVDLPFSLKGTSALSEKSIATSQSFPPFPQKVPNGSFSVDQNEENLFPIPPTIYPKPNECNNVSNQNPPEVKKRNAKKKHMVKKANIETVSHLPLNKNCNDTINKVDNTQKKMTKSQSNISTTPLAPFELTDERVSLEFARELKPPPPLLPRCPTNAKPPVLPRCPTNPKTRTKAPPRPENQQLPLTDCDILSTSSPVLQTKLPKPLAPMPANATPVLREKSKSREMVLADLKPNVNKGEFLASPIAMIDSKDMTVSFKKESNNTNSESVIFKRELIDTTGISTHHKTRNNHKISVDERDIRKVCDRNATELINFESASKPLYFDSKSPPRSHSMMEMNKIQTLSYGSKDDMEVNATENMRSIDLQSIETQIVELKGKIEATAYQLSGVETLLDFVSEDKVGHLMAERDKHNENISELNFELNVLEDRKSSLLASYGKVDDVKNRVAEIEKQIDQYLDNCDKLRRMQDLSVIEDLPEIRDHIEFCENMIDTLQDELNGLRDKLGELDQADSSDPEKEVAKMKRNQKKVIDELVHTEERYVRDLSVASDVMKHLEESVSQTVNIKILFGNLPVIIELAKKLLCELKEIITQSMQDEIPSRIASCFLDLCTEMKECYSDYCRNYDDAQSLLEKYEEDPEVMFTISKVLKRVSLNDANLINLQAYLIKPVQRVLKYPLLFAELLKNHITEGLSKECLKFALGQLTDVATAINEFKRRKDLVQKYREIEDGIGKKVQKLNWHSVAKKSSRINQRITQFTGLKSQTIDHTFTELEKRFRGLEKLIKSFSKNVIQFLEEFQGNSSHVKQCSESIRQFFEDNEVCEEVIKYYSRIYVITEQYTSNMVIFTNRHVTEPLNQLLQLFQGPFRLIQKRNDKCLDYDRAQNKAMKAKDSKDEDKIKQTHEELQNSANVYTALNAQLLEELPALCDNSSSFLKYCLANFVEMYKRYLSSSYHQIYELWRLPFVSKDGDMLEIHQQLINSACDQLSLLSFVPFGSTKDGNKKTLTAQTLPNNFNRTSFFVDLDDLGSDPTTVLKPLIDINGNDFDEIDKSKDKSSKAKLFGTSDWTYQEETNKYVVKYNFQAEDEVELSAAEGTNVTVLRKSDKKGNSEWWYVDVGGQKGYIPQSYLVADTNTDLRYERSKSSIMSNILVGNVIKKLDTCRLQSAVNSNGCDATEFPAPPPELIPDLLTDEHHKLNIGDNSVNKFNTINDTLGAHNLPCTENKNDNTAQPYNNVQYYFMEYNFEGENSGELSIREGEMVKVLTKHDQKGNTEWWYVDYNGEKGYVPGGFLLFLDEAPMC